MFKNKHIIWMFNLLVINKGLDIITMNKDYQRTEFLGQQKIKYSEDFYEKIKDSEDLDEIMLSSATELFPGSENLDKIMLSSATELCPGSENLDKIMLSSASELFPGSENLDKIILSSATELFPGSENLDKIILSSASELFPGSETREYFDQNLFQGINSRQLHVPVTSTTNMNSSAQTPFRFDNFVSTACATNNPLNSYSIIGNTIHPNVNNLFEAPLSMNHTIVIINPNFQQILPIANDVPMNINPLMNHNSNIIEPFKNGLNIHKDLMMHVNKNFVNESKRIQDRIQKIMRELLNDKLNIFSFDRIKKIYIENLKTVIHNFPCELHLFCLDQQEIIKQFLQNLIDMFNQKHNELKIKMRQLIKENYHKNKTTKNFNAKSTKNYHKVKKENPEAFKARQMKKKLYYEINKETLKAKRKIYKETQKIKKQKLNNTIKETIKTK